MKMMKVISLMGAAVATTVAVAVEGEVDWRHPPPSARPQVWWHWMNGNVSKEGITADLEAMNAVGIGGAHIFDVSIGIPKGPVEFNTPQWHDHVRWAAREAKRLGIELGLSNCSGFSASGGPWVTPEDAMKKLVWTDVSVTGPSKFAGVLPQYAETNGFYRDVAVVAFRTPKAVRLADVSAKVVRNGKASATISFDKPFRATMLGFRLDSDSWSAGCPVKVEASDDGKSYRTLLERRVYTRLSGRVDPSMRNLVLPDTTARYYRVTAMPRRGLTVTLHDVDLGRWGGLESLPMKTFAFKAELFGLSDVTERGQAAPEETVPDVLNLTDRLKPDGTLDWVVPAGEWRLLRFGCAATGAMTLPTTPAGAGLETDKLNAASTRRHFNAYIGKLLASLGPDRDVIDTVLVDSYEVGAQNWTQGFEGIFKKRLGYGVVPYLPVFAGYVVKDVETSERFLADFRRVVADLFAENYADEMARLCHANGLKFSLEPHGDFGSDDMRYGQNADIVIGNFWSGEKGTVSPGVERLVASIAHVWGRKYIGSEAFTAQPKGWRRTPSFIKAQGDYAYSLGINRIIYHRYAHQPWTNPACVPGMTMGRWGMHFERTQTWWPLAKSWVAYQTRCQHMLQEGRFVADVALFCGEAAPNSLVGVDKIPRGYGFDGCAAAAVMAMRVENGELVLPSGMRYRLLALPDSERMSLAMLEKIGSLVESGATVVGRKPEKAIGLAGGSAMDARIKSLADKIWKRGVLEMPVEDALRVKGIQPDFEGPAIGISYTHRKYRSGADAYFVAWQGADEATIRCSFRQKGRIPELWNPETGERIQAPEWRVNGNRTEVAIDFEPRGSVFVVFRAKAENVKGASRRTVRKTTHEQGVADGWELAFPAGWGAPERVGLDKLVSWTELKDDGAKYFSGTATYTRRIALDRPLAAGERLQLDLGEVNEFAEVKVNGVSYPVLWKNPFRLDITDAVRDKRTVDVVIKVTNLWPNRLIGDEHLPPHNEWSGPRLKAVPDWVKRGERSPTGRFTFTTWHHWKKDDKLLPSGIRGPVVLRYWRSERKKPDSPARLSELRNAGFEDAGEGKAACWNAFAGGYVVETSVRRSGAASAKCVSTGIDGAGAKQEIVYDVPDRTPVVFGGWCRSVDAEASPQFYLDVEYVDGTWEWALHVDWMPGTHAWSRRAAVFEPKKPVRRICAHALMRNGKGTAWFDDLFLSRRDASFDVLSVRRTTDRPYGSQDFVQIAFGNAVSWRTEGAPSVSRGRGRFARVPVDRAARRLSLRLDNGKAEKTVTVDLPPSTLPANPLKPAEVAVWTADSMRMVTPLTFPSADERRRPPTVSLELARRERESAQVLVSTGDARTLADVAIRLSPLVSADGRLKGEVTWNRVGYLAREIDRRYYVHSHGANPEEKWLPDPLLPPRPFNVRKGATQGVWLTVHAAADARPGLYTGTMTLVASGRKFAEVAIAVRVMDFALPERFGLATSFSVMDGFTRSLYPETFAAIRRQSHNLLLDSRLNPDDISRTEPPSVEDVAYWRSRGMSVYNLLNWVPPPKDPKRKWVCITTEEEAFKPELYDYVKGRLAPLVAELRRRDLLDGAYIYGFDERGGDFYGGIERLWRRWRKDFPDVPLMTTAYMFRDRVRGRKASSALYATDWHCPLTSVYDETLADEYRARGKKVWWYVCCVPLDPYANFASIEYPWADGRLLGWMTWRYRAEGLLYWHVNYWQGKRRLADGDTFFPHWRTGNSLSMPGDGILLYPGEDALWPSIRLAAVRDGEEDWEWLDRAAAAVGRRRVEEVVGGLIKTMTAYTRDPAKIRAARARIAALTTAIVKGP